MKKVLFLFVFLFSVLGAAAKNLQQVVFKVEQMTCVNCEAKVKRNIPYEKGVKNMKTDVANHTVTVTFDADVTNVANLQKGPDGLIRLLRKRKVLTIVEACEQIPGFKLICNVRKRADDER